MVRIRFWGVPKSAALSRKTCVRKSASSPSSLAARRSSSNSGRLRETVDVLEDEHPSVGLAHDAHEVAPELVPHIRRVALAQSGEALARRPTDDEVDFGNVS